MQEADGRALSAPGNRLENNKNMAQVNGREQWLAKATEMLLPIFGDVGFATNVPLAVSPGFAPKSKAAALETPGICFPKGTTEGGVAQIYINPTIHRAADVMAALMPQLLHALLADSAETADYKAGMAKIGLIGKVKKPRPNADLDTDLIGLAAYMEGAYGAYPQPAFSLEAALGAKPVVGRMLKIVCPPNETHDSEIPMRASQKVLDMGDYRCFCGRIFLRVDPDGNVAPGAQQGDE